MGNSTECGDPTFIFASFDNLFKCDEEYGNYATESENAYTNAVWDCVNDYCREPDNHIKGCGRLQGRQFDFYAFRYGGYEYFDSSKVCTGISSEANNDMGGPGVSSNALFITKTGLTLLFNIGLHFISNANWHRVLHLSLSPHIPIDSNGYIFCRSV